MRSSAMPLVTLRRGSRRPFFCCAAGFGDVLALAQLSALLGPDRPSYALQAALPDQHGRPAGQRLDALVELYLACVRRVQPDGPYLLGGNSSGGLVAFEMARRLRGNGQDVALLALLDTPVELNTTTRLLHALLARSVRRVLPHAESHAPTSLRIVRAMLHDDGLDATVRAVHGYRARQYAGRLVVLHSTGRYLGVRFMSPRPWRSLGSHDLTLEPVPGDHITFLRRPHAAILAERLRQHLDSVSVDEYAAT
jgi:thioesterase domain-containing protein